MRSRFSLPRQTHTHKQKTKILQANLQSQQGLKHIKFFCSFAFFEFILHFSYPNEPLCPILSRFCMFYLLVEHAHSSACASDRSNRFYLYFFRCHCAIGLCWSAATHWNWKNYPLFWFCLHFWDLDLDWLIKWTHPAASDFWNAIVMNSSFFCCTTIMAFNLLTFEGILCIFFSLRSWSDLITGFVYNDVYLIYQQDLTSVMFFRQNKK